MKNWYKYFITKDLKVSLDDRYSFSKYQLIESKIDKNHSTILFKLGLK